MQMETLWVERQCPQAGAIRLHVAACGRADAPPLFFVHGFPEFWWAWREQLAHFSKDFRCYAIDLRGFNLSSQPTEVSAYKTSLILDDLRAAIAQLASGRVHAVIAHDWGGAAAWSLAAQSPELMDRFVVINSPHTLMFAKALALDEAQIAASGYMNWLRTPGAEAVLAENGFERLLKMASVTGDEAIAAYRACWARGLTGGCNYYRASPLYPDTPETVGRAASFFAALRPEPFRVTLPTQIIWGTADTALRPVLLEGIEAHVPGVQIARIEGASHWLLRENPDQVNATIRSFVS
ncbi:MAG: alpha/beta fold hydrolase [Betaproteobacteria bacterium]|nr:MAG: alpha/beta fold hydrolase [Betaproteobacteria bacterium]